MDRTEKRAAKSAEKTKPDDADATADPASWSRTLRETIESVVIAFVLAFLFRTFEAEAFVIPTGSMAPTLMGRHLDMVCPKCGYTYRVGLPEEVPGRSSTRPEIDSCLCPLCRYTVIFKSLSPEEIAACPPYSGDRILVSKFAFDVAPPERWDVIVFKYPEDAKTNYIKRLIGLPGEIIRIRDGDIAVSTDAGKTFVTQTKSPAKMKAMLQIVYDNDFLYEPFMKLTSSGVGGWPARWHDAGSHDSGSHDGGSGGWQNAKSADGGENLRVFETAGSGPDGKSAKAAWLQYDHYVPDSGDWKNFLADQPFATRNPAPKPILDFIAYDAANDRSSAVVSDLAVEFEADVKAATGQLAIDLAKKGRRYRCLLDLTNGSVRLTIPGRAEKDQPLASSGGISAAGTYHILFANVDHQLTLQVNDKTVTFDHETTYDRDGNDPLSTPDADRPPAAIGSMGAPLAVNHLRLWRDVYYTYADNQGAPSGHANYRDFDAPAQWPGPEAWRCYPAEKAAELAKAGADVQRYDQYYFLGPNEYFPLGDNSPLSSDARLWNHEHSVDRRLLVGKALFIYWPHGYYRWHLTKDFYIGLPLPLFPNFGRMGFVR